MTRVPLLLCLAGLLPLARPMLATIDEDWQAVYYKGHQAVLAKDYAKAESIYAEALHTAQMFGKDDVRVAATEQALGEALHQEKKLGEAEAALQRAVDIFAVTPGDTSIEYGLALFDLAGVQMDEGKYQPALLALNLALPNFDANLVPNDNRTAAGLCMQGNTLLMLKRYASAETPLKRCADIQSENSEIDTPAFAAAANSLAIAYAHLGELTDADRYFTYAARIREKLLGVQSPELAETLEAHAALLHQMGRDAEAKPMEKMAAAIRARANRK